MPTATQKVVVVQLTLVDGSTAPPSVQVAPPSVVTITTPSGDLPGGSLTYPTATQSDDEPHETLSSPVVPVGTACALHVVPPSVDPTMPDPVVASQTDVVGQDTPDSVASWPLTAWGFQAAPDESVVTIEAVEAVPPTAAHDQLEGQSIDVSTLLSDSVLS